MRNLRQRLLPALISLLAVTAAGVLAGTAPAAAAPAPSTPLVGTSGKTTTKYASTTLTRKTGSGPSAALTIITCGAFITTPVVQDVPGNLPESTVEARCDGVVDSIALVVTLRRNGPDANDASTQLGTFVQSDNGAVSTSLLCLARPHNYQGFGSAVFRKAGFVGSPLQLTGATPVVTGTC